MVADGDDYWFSVCDMARVSLLPLELGCKASQLARPQQKKPPLHIYGGERKKIDKKKNIWPNRRVSSMFAILYATTDGMKVYR